ncbi:MAG: hypothetical protein ISS74_06310 [Planctomycetes bacterium]|nr:hypothetical protein [Planctomycetota bacterium]
MPRRDGCSAPGLSASLRQPCLHARAAGCGIAAALLLLVAVLAVAGDGPPAPLSPRQPSGTVCPPFHLLDEDGNIIDPVAGTNADKPYSPRETCGKCHDYETITQAYHFMQGKGEEPTADQAARCQWALTPGNYGGTWCSPAPLYRYLSPKKNESPATMDMTSFTFITAGCGACHPGGGSAEYDRDGKRYDRWMADPASGLSPGGENGLDGDYSKARWSETGVLEADCLLCHLPEYDFTERKKQLAALNFRWAATAGAGVADVTGSVEKGEPVTVVYDKSRFNPDGTLSPHIIREPRNEACLACHEQPGWKKRGANFRARTDVHLRAGLRCVDCHPAGSSADDPRIRGKELHEIGKGDDPGGQVRNDLNNTMRDCAHCHSTGRLGAPVAKHRWLPPLHLDTIACETCHIPERLVKPIQFQASDVFNPGTKIPSKGKHLWTFYGPDGAYRNHYGYLEMMGFDDKPTEPFKPFLARYEGKIWPVNRVHTAWPGIEIEGKPGLMQPKMSDVYAMWSAHRQDPAKFPDLAKIADDNGDGVIEVNRPEEIDALIASVTAMLNGIHYPMDGKRVVWAYNDRVYTSGTEYRTIPKHEWEASPYGNVHKYAHDVYPARSALGVNGCTDCHHPSADFFFASTVKYPFDAQGEPVTEPQYRPLGLNGFWAMVGAWREAYLKPVLYGLLVALVCSLVVLAGELHLAWVFGDHPVRRRLRLIPWAAALAIAVATAALAWQPDLMGYMLTTRFALDANHTLVAGFVFVAGVAALLCEVGLHRPAAAGSRRTSGASGAAVWLLVALGLAAVSGLLMFLKVPGLDTPTRASYTVFDLALVLVLAGVVYVALRRAVRPGRVRAHEGG